MSYSNYNNNNNNNKIPASVEEEQFLAEIKAKFAGLKRGFRRLPHPNDQKDVNIQELLLNFDSTNWEEVPNENGPREQPQVGDVFITLDFKNWIDGIKNWGRDTKWPHSYFSVSCRQQESTDAAAANAPTLRKYIYTLPKLKADKMLVKVIHYTYHSKSNNNKPRKQAQKQQHQHQHQQQEEAVATSPVSPASPQQPIMLPPQVQPHHGFMVPDMMRFIGIVPVQIGQPNATVTFDHQYQAATGVGNSFIDPFGQDHISLQEDVSDDRTDESSTVILPEICLIEELLNQANVQQTIVLQDTEEDQFIVDQYQLPVLEAATTSEPHAAHEAVAAPDGDSGEFYDFLELKLNMVKSKMIEKRKRCDDEDSDIIETLNQVLDQIAMKKARSNDRDVNLLGKDNGLGKSRGGKTLDRKDTSVVKTIEYLEILSGIKEIVRRLSRSGFGGAGGDRDSKVRNNNNNNSSSSSSNVSSKPPIRPDNRPSTTAAAAAAANPNSSSSRTKSYWMRSDQLQDKVRIYVKQEATNTEIAIDPKKSKCVQGDPLSASEEVSISVHNHFDKPIDIALKTKSPETGKMKLIETGDEEEQFVTRIMPGKKHDIDGFAVCTDVEEDPYEFYVWCPAATTTTTTKYEISLWTTISFKLTAATASTTKLINYGRAI